MKRIATQFLASVLLLLTLIITQNIAAQTKVVLPGNFQDELGCPGDWQPDCDATALTYDGGTGLWSGTFVLDTGYWQYKVAYNGTWNESYGEDGGPDNIWLYVPVKSDITFVYNPATHLVTSTPYSGIPSDIPAKEVQLFGQLQDELGCPGEWVWACSNSALSYNMASGKWEGTFSLPAGCYKYVVKVIPEKGNIRLYGENGAGPDQNLQLYLPQTADVTFSYDATTHLVTTSPYGSPGPGVRKVSLYGTLQDEIGCNSDWQYLCDNAGLTYNATSGKWEGKFYLPAGCYVYQVKEEFGCDVSNVFYGEGGVQDGPYIQLSVPQVAEITFSYDPVTHLVTTTPYGSPSGVSKVSLVGSFQNELGCDYDYDMNCDNPALSYDEATGKWTGAFTLPAGCHTYQVKETDGCNNITVYGEGGVLWGMDISLYVPEATDVTFTYDAKTHLMTVTPDPEVPVSTVTLVGDLQSELGCPYDGYPECSNSQLVYNEATGRWEGTFTLPAGCYNYSVMQTTDCGIAYYGQDGVKYGNPIQLYLPATETVTFSYDAQTHLISSTPEGTPPQGVTKVSLAGSLQNELGCSYDYDLSCDNAALFLDAASGKWMGKYTLPAGCYSYQVKETVGCNTINVYGEDGVLYGNFIQLYLPETAEVTFVYDAQTHIISTAPYGPAPSVVTKVSLRGDLQSETGCSYDFDDNCDNPALAYNETTGMWEGTFTLPAGCYAYHVKVTSGCNNTTLYGEGGQVWGNMLQLYVPAEAAVTFVYDPETHTITSTPYSGYPVTGVSLVGDLQTQLGCSFNWDYAGCDKTALTYNEATGLWEGTFSLEAGCYKYVLKQSKSCNIVDVYGKDGSNYANEYYNYYTLYVPQKTDVTFTYDPQTHLVSSAYNGECPPDIVVLPGNFQSELGCTQVQYGLPDGDWEPACDATRLTYDAASGLFTGTFALPAGNWEFKVAYNHSWMENYGLDGLRDGPNIPLELCVPSQVTFTYNYKTHLVALEFHPTAICISKFYDANVNGINDEGLPMAGVEFTLSGKSSAVQYTDSEGQTTFSGLAEGNYTVTETLQPGWLATGPLTRSLTLTNPTTLNFGNVCLGAGGAHPVSFWTNKHGAEVLNDGGSVAPELALLSSLSLRNEDGSHFAPASYQQLVDWLKRANAKNMAYKLSAELAALLLSVEAGFVSDSSMVYANIGDPMGRDNFTDVKGLMDKVNEYLQADGYTPGGDGNRAMQEFLKYVLEQVNHNLTFVQPQPCGSVTVMAKGSRVAEAERLSPLAGARISPNPSSHDFSLQLAAGSTGEPVYIRVMDAHGKLVYAAHGPARQEYRFGEDFTAGLYFVELVQGTWKSTLKVVKQ